ncbi:MAG: decarboxylase [Hyphomicrobiales bacterium]|nr:decarboxylase [Hyphomicrobiales bacterium]
MIVRTLSRDDFIARFGGIFEHSAWVAEGAYDKGLGPESDSAEGLHADMAAIMRAAPKNQQLALINAHPDLAGKLHAAGRLTQDSTKEQSSAGLDMLTDAERKRFTELNDAYKARFGFPFILAVKGKTKADILEAFETRLHHSEDQEFATALEQIEKIALLRLKEMLR